MPFRKRSPEIHSLYSMNIGGLPKKSIEADTISANPPITKTAKGNLTELIMLPIPLNIRNPAWIKATLSGIGEVV